MLGGFLSYKRLAVQSLTPSAAVQLIRFLLLHLSNFRPGAIIAYHLTTNQFAIMFSKAIILSLVTVASVNALVIRQSTNLQLVVLMSS